MIRKAVLPVAGFGSRCIPASKAMPKEMITIVVRPVIQYGLEATHVTTRECNG